MRILIWIASRHRNSLPKHWPGSDRL